MGDFHQSGLVTTLHRLGPSSVDRMEAELAYHAREKPVSLVLPCLYSEIEGPALKRIVEVLAHVPYLHEVIVSVSGTPDFRDFDDVRRFFSAVPNATCVWVVGGPYLDFVKCILVAFEGKISAGLAEIDPTIKTELKLAVSPHALHARFRRTGFSKLRHILKN